MGDAQRVEKRAHHRPLVLEVIRDDQARRQQVGELDQAGEVLGALGIAHDDGLIKDESPAKPDAAKLDAGVKTLAAAYPKDQVARYFWALLWQDPDTWGGLKDRPELTLA